MIFILALFLVFLFIVVLVAVTEDGVAGMVKDFLDALDMIRDYRKGKRKRKKED